MIFFLYGFFIILTVSTCAESKYAIEGDFKFASYLQSNMVLQQAPHSALLWGYGKLGSSIRVTLDKVDHVTTVKNEANGQGVWRIVLNPHKAGGPFNITAMQLEPPSTIVLQNIMFGEVWFCSGQSNMQFALEQAFNASYELAQVKNYPNVRIFYAAMETSDVALLDLKAIRTPWSVPTSSTVSTFSAVCWLYGKYLYNQMKIPIGLVHSAWGGTPVETWMSNNALKKCGLDKEYNPLDVKKPFPPIPMYKSMAPNPNPQNNSLLWNAMVHPFLNMTIKGAIWYQGEQNAYYHMNSYNCSFPSMIDDWRKSWFAGTHGLTDPTFPFGFVQLCVRNEPTWMDDGDYSTIRWHQTADFGYVPNTKMPKTFMAVTLDLPDSGIPFNSPHTRDKQDVAKRLSAASLDQVYGYKIPFLGPYPVRIFSSSAQDLEIDYGDTQNLVVKNTQNFQICCSPLKCPESETFSGPNWKNTTISSWSQHSIKLDIGMCAQGANAVRYAWTVTPCPFKDCQVYNDHGLPAAPFIHQFL